MFQRNFSTINVKIASHQKGSNVSFTLSNSAKPKPLNLIAVLDSSGSMSFNSQEVSNNNTTRIEGTKFSRMELLQHSMKTTVNLLRPEDTLTLVTFSNQANILLKEVKMNDDGKSLSLDVIRNMHPYGSTNLFDGLSTGVNIAKSIKNKNKDSHVSILLQTDGEPTHDLNPPRGIIPTLENLVKNIESKPSIHTCGYGFGDKLESKLLRDIAQLGNGSYSYIPDGSMVGTVFIHFLANMLHVSVLDVQAAFVPNDDFVLPSILNIGSIRPGQSKNFWFPRVSKSSQTFKFLENPPLQLKDLKADSPFSIDIQYQILGEQTFIYQSMRDFFHETIKMAVKFADNNQIEQSKMILRKAYDTMIPYSDNDSRIKSILDDLDHPSSDKGQIMKSFEYWNKWGKHFIPSVLSAHSRQEKVNFKDKSMEVYSTNQLNEFINHAEKIFCQLPVVSKRATQKDLEKMMDEDYGCFIGETLIKLDSGEEIRIDHLKKGQILKNGFKVRCLVKFHLKGPIEFYRIKNTNFGITSWHPIKVESKDEWIFPNNPDACILHKTKENCKYLYNLVLDSGHYIESSGVKCVTLGHSFKDNNVVFHPYFGSQKIIDDLQRMSGFDDGFVEFTNLLVQRDEQGFVNEFSNKTISCSSFLLEI